MKVSARNAFDGTITAITPGAVNTEVELTTANGDKIVAIVTNTSVLSLALAEGKPAIALVKAPWVMILAEDPGLRFSARNRFSGTVSSVVKGEVNSQVGLTLAGGTEIHAVITNDAVLELGLAIGKKAGALIKASHVILAVPN